MTGAGLPGRGRAGPAAGQAEPAGAELAARIVGLLTQRQQTVAVAESLTGGLLGAAITTVPGASVVFRGGVIAYATDLKAALLGVPAALLAERGAVDPDVAGAMAAGVALRLGATAGVATTGWPGPTRRTASRPAPFTSRYARAAERWSRRSPCPAAGTRSGGARWSGHCGCCGACWGKKARDYSVTSSANTDACALPYCR